MRYPIGKNISREREDGFTLLELSFVIIIIGITMIPILHAIDRYYEQRRVDYTERTIRAATDMIVEFRSNGVPELFNNNSYVYPCPSRRDLPSNHTDFGMSIDCDNLAAYGLNNAGDCNMGICLAASNPAQDKDGNGATDLVIIGGFPVTSMQIAESSGQNLDFRTDDYFSTRMDTDGWNSQLTYAVTYNLTQADSLENFWHGVISAQDEFGNPTAGVSNDAHFAIISHGPDRKGAYNANGIQAAACGTTTNDDENCDNDSTFIQSLGSYMGGGTEHFDDFIRFSKETSLSIWEETQDSIGRDQLYFAPSGNLGINEDAAPPNIAMSVNGTLQANNNILVDEICDEPKLNPDTTINADADCFDPEIITGDVGNCRPDQALKGIWNGVKQCEDIVFEVPGTGQLENASCSGVGNGWLRGFKSNGELICY